MNTLANKRAIIGESPIWNDREQKLYVTNGMENEILIYDIINRTVKIRKTSAPIAAICFSANNRPIVSCQSGIGILEKDNTIIYVYNNDKYTISYANDMKVGPDRRIYVGTQSSKRLGISDEIDGKLYSIDKFGNVSVLLDGLLLSNGLDWSPNEKIFYHTDSDTGIIKEYYFDKSSGKITFSGRELSLPGVDGLCVAENGDIYAAVWGGGHIAVIDALKLQIKKAIRVPTNMSVSCNFIGKNAELLAITTATYDSNINDKKAGLTFLYDAGIKGKLPYCFESIYDRRY